MKRSLYTSTPVLPQPDHGAFSVFPWLDSLYKGFFRPYAGTIEGSTLQANRIGIVVIAVQRDLPITEGLIVSTDCKLKMLMSTVTGIIRHSRRMQQGQGQIAPPGS